ncbi:MAG: recombinase RecF, partial [Oscillospiraceae bacterium]
AQTNEVIQKRIEELEQAERNLAVQLADLDKQIYLSEEFTRAKVEMLEQKINNTFQYAKFKMFDEQVNGGLSECCEAMCDGVPYADLNNAMKINLGLDIINAISNHDGIYAPIFIDNAESVTELIAVKTQIIRLVVSEQDKELRNA